MTSKHQPPTLASSCRPPFLERRPSERFPRRRARRFTHYLEGRAHMIRGELAALEAASDLDAALDLLPCVLARCVLGRFHHVLLHLRVISPTAKLGRGRLARNSSKQRIRAASTAIARVASARGP